MSEPVIVGGGPAGAAAAILLAHAGRQATLIERHAEPVHKVCGDFLSGEAMTAIAALGVDLAALTPARIDTLRLIHGQIAATTALPFPAVGLTRRALDEALLQQAAASGADVMRGHVVREVRKIGASLELNSPTLGAVPAATVFLATGKHDLRGAARPRSNDGPIGMKMYFQLQPSQLAELRGHIELVLFAGGYAGLQLVEADQAVLCLLAPRDMLQRVGAAWDALLDLLLTQCPHLACRLNGAQPLLERRLAVGGLPYGYLAGPDSHQSPALFRLGDQASVIASLTGDGVALALASASLAVKTWLVQGNAAQSYHRDLTRTLSGQMRVASVIHRLFRAPAMQPWLVRACRVSPGTMRMAARATRLRHAR